MSNIYQPYTYLIGWSKLNLWYYGVRYGRNCHPDDLWKTYFTSSTYVSDLRLKHGEPNIIQIRQTFDTPEKALSWESKVLIRMRVVESDDWINKRANNWTSYAITDEIRAKISKANKNKVVSNETRNKLSIACTGWKHTEEAKRKIGKYNRGKNVSNETRNKLSIACTGWKHTEEAKRKIGNIHKNKIISEKTRQKMREGQRKRRSAEKITKTQYKYK